MKYLLSDPVNRFEIIGCSNKQEEYMLFIEVNVFDTDHPSRVEGQLMRN